MFRYCLNASTIQHYGLDLEGQVDVAIEAGFSGIELWMGDIRSYADRGGSLGDLARKLVLHGLEFSNAIAFQAWCSPDPVARRQALVDIDSEMKLIGALGGKAYAAPPWGIDPDATFEEIAGYFDALTIVGRENGIEPYLEFWGHAPVLNSLEQASSVLDRCRASSPRLLADVYHIHRSGGKAESLRALPPGRIGIFHINDFPDIPSSDIKDEDRVFPGEGCADWPTYREILAGIGYSGMLSLELFPKGRMGLTALGMARRGLETSRRVMDPAEG